MNSLKKYRIEISLPDNYFYLDGKLEVTKVHNCDIELAETNEGHWYKAEDIDPLIALFCKYIRHVESCEGIDYIDYHDYDKATQLMEKEQSLLNQIKQTIEENGNK